MEDEDLREALEAAEAAAELRIEVANVDNIESLEDRHMDQSLRRSRKGPGRDRVARGARRGHLGREAEGRVKVK
jgi:hypothetical protein